MLAETLLSSSSASSSTTALSASQLISEEELFATPEKLSFIVDCFARAIAALACTQVFDGCESFRRDACEIDSASMPLTMVETSYYYGGHDHEITAERALAIEKCRICFEFAKSVKRFATDLHYQAVVCEALQTEFSGNVVVDVSDAYDDDNNDNDNKGGYAHDYGNGANASGFPKLKCPWKDSYDVSNLLTRQTVLGNMGVKLFHESIKDSVRVFLHSLAIHVARKYKLKSSARVPKSVPAKRRERTQEAASKRAASARCKISDAISMFLCGIQRNSHNQERASSATAFSASDGSSALDRVIDAIDSVLATEMACLFEGAEGSASGSTTTTATTATTATTSYPELPKFVTVAPNFEKANKRSFLPCPPWLNDPKENDQWYKLTKRSEHAIRAFLNFVTNCENPKLVILCLILRQLIVQSVVPNHDLPPPMLMPLRFSTTLIKGLCKHEIALAHSVLQSLTTAVEDMAHAYPYIIAKKKVLDWKNELPELENALFKLSNISCVEALSCFAPAAGRTRALLIDRLHLSANKNLTRNFPFENSFVYASFFSKLMLHMLIKFRSSVGVCMFQKLSSHADRLLHFKDKAFNEKTGKLEIRTSALADHSDLRILLDRLYQQGVVDFRKDKKASYFHFFPDVLLV